MSWLFVLTDRNGVAIGELRDTVSARTVNLPLDRVTTGVFTIRTDNYLANTVRSVDQVLMKAYRNGSLVGLGPLTPGYQKQVQPDSRTIQVSWSGVGWRLGRRLIEASKSTSGITYGVPSDSTQWMERGLMAQSIVNGLNAATPPVGAAQSVMDTGIRIGTIGTTAKTAVGPWYYKNALQGISELSATLDGYDWEVAPHEPTVDATGLWLGTLNVSAGIGAYRPDCVFEYGDGKYNVSAFTEQQDFTNALNRAYSLPQDFPTNSTGSALTYADIVALGNSGTIYEDVVPSDLVTDDMRTRLLNEYVLVGKVPKTVITFQPTVSQSPGVVPNFGTDYIVGDLVRFRAVENGVETVNGLFRVYEVDFSIDENGAELATPILVSQDS